MPYGAEQYYCVDNFRRADTNVKYIGLNAQLTTKRVLVIEPNTFEIQHHQQQYKSFTFHTLADIWKHTTLPRVCQLFY